MSDSGSVRSDITRLLTTLGKRTQLDADSREELAARVYPELRRLAAALMSRERGGHTLQPTALANEAWLRLVDSDKVEWEGRAHFFGAAARCMRQILVDYARARNAEKRGGGRQRVTLDDDMLSGDDADIELIALNDALDKLAALDERAGRVAEMRLFAGMTIAEVAAALDVSARTVDGDWATARLWLSRELSG